VAAGPRRPGPGAPAQAHASKRRGPGAEIAACGAATVAPEQHRRRRSLISRNAAAFAAAAAGGGGGVRPVASRCSGLCACTDMTRAHTVGCRHVRGFQVTYRPPATVTAGLSRRCTVIMLTEVRPRAGSGSELESGTRKLAAHQNSTVAVTASDSEARTRMRRLRRLRLGLASASAT
jgi:hypothetical protein